MFERIGLGMLAVCLALLAFACSSESDSDSGADTSPMEDTSTSEDMAPDVDMGGGIDFTSGLMLPYENQFGGPGGTGTLCLDWRGEDIGNGAYGDPRLVVYAGNPSVNGWCNQGVALLYFQYDGDSALSAGADASLSSTDGVESDAMLMSSTVGTVADNEVTGLELNTETIIETDMYRITFTASDTEVRVDGFEAL